MVATPTWPVWLDHGHWVVGRPVIVDLTDMGATADTLDAILAAPPHHISRSQLRFVPAELRVIFEAKYGPLGPSPGKAACRE
jgi:hypothetical protein